MTKTAHKKIFLALLFVWLALWVNFTARDLTKKKYLKEYGILLSRNAEGRASYAYGDGFFEFLKFCAASLPAGAGYDLQGPEEGSIDSRRAIYYLYPHFKEKGASYILVFGEPGYYRQGYAPFKWLDTSRFILKRIL